MTDSLFSQSLDQWSLRTGGDIHDWRGACAVRWERIRRSEHWHGGKTCVEVGCGVARKPQGEQT